MIDNNTSPQNPFLSNTATTEDIRTTNTQQLNNNSSDLIAHDEYQNKHIYADPNRVNEVSNLNEEVQKPGLRRSTRVPKPRVSVEIDFGPERSYTKRKKDSKKPGPKPKNQKNKTFFKKSKITNESKDTDLTSKEKKSLKDKSKLDQKNKTKVRNIDKKVVKKPKKPVKKVTKKLTKKELMALKLSKGIGLQEPSLNNANWSSSAPLLSSDFKNQPSVISRLRSPNTKPIYYAGDIVKIMAFINKFSNYFGSDTLSLSFQDFEVGLDLYPCSSPYESKGIFSETKGCYVLYQDYILIKEVIASQDKMTLVFVTLLKLLFCDEKTFGEPLELQDIAPYPKKDCQYWLNELNKNVSSWGYPREWRKLTSTDRQNFEIKFFDHDDTKFIDPNTKEVLTPNLYRWPKVINCESGPLQNSELYSKGILGLEPADRIIFLRALVDWCAAHSTIIHNEIQQLSHFKRDPAFGIETQHVPRYFVEGPNKTFKCFKELCKLVESRFEIRSLKKHYRKQLKEGKQPDLQQKLDLIKEIKDTLQNAEPAKKEEVFYSLYDKWLTLFEGEIIDNPLSNPFDDPIYKLRCQEFFIGRIPRMGDFYIPRLYSYGSESKINTYTDLRKLTEILEKFSSGVYSSYTLFENFGQTMSGKFKILYHDTPSLVRDVNKGNSTTNKVYWYEMCHDSRTLKEFIQLLDYKIVIPSDKNVDEETPSVENPDNNKPLGEEKKSSQLVSHDNRTEKNLESMVINMSPLPKDAKYNTARYKLKELRDYLSKILSLFECYEELKEKYGDMVPGKRQLRRVRRQNYVDEYVEDSD